MKLTARLMTIASQVKKGSTIADIGTDHGYIPAYLIKNKIAQRAIATDVNKGPLDRAKETVKLYNLEEFIETRLGNGLDSVAPHEVDTVIIAGMGGLLIRDILKNHLEVAKSATRLILQPMVAQNELRRWLLENGFKIVDEHLVKEDHRIYEIIVVEVGKQQVEDEIYYEIGQKLIENADPLLETFIKKRIKKENDIMDQLLGQKSENAKVKLEECKLKMDKLEEVLRCLKNAEKL